MCKRRRIHRIGGVVPIDNDRGGIGRWDIVPEVEHFHVPRFTSGVARFASGDGWDRYAIVGNGNRVSVTRITIGPDTYGDAFWRTSRRMVPCERRFTGGPGCPCVGFRRTDVGNSHLVDVIQDGALNHEQRRWTGRDRRGR